MVTVDKEHGGGLVHVTGQRMRIFLRAASLLSELNAFDASTISIASAPSSSKRFLIAWIPASHAASCAAHSCMLLTVFRISSRVTLRMALEMRRLRVSPTPGRLSRAMRRQDVRAEIPFGSTCFEHSFLVSLATELHKSSEAL